MWRFPHVASWDHIECDLQQPGGNEDRGTTVANLDDALECLAAEDLAAPFTVVFVCVCLDGFAPLVLVAPLLDGLKESRAINCTCWRCVSHELAIRSSVAGFVRVDPRPDEHLGKRGVGSTLDPDSRGEFAGWFAVSLESNLPIVGGLLKEVTSSVRAQLDDHFERIEQLGACRVDCQRSPQALVRQVLIDEPSAVARSVEYLPPRCLTDLHEGRDVVKGERQMGCVSWWSPWWLEGNSGFRCLSN